MTITERSVTCTWQQPSAEASCPAACRRSLPRRLHCRHRCASSLPGDTASDSSGQDVCRRVRRRPPLRRNSNQRSSYSDSDSLSDSNEMPVGIDSLGLKTSLSLSSLPPGTPSDSPEHVRLRIRPDRQYHSLTKQTRRVDQSASWRKSWGSGISSDDREFWEAFQADYDYLMAQTMVPQAAQIPVLGEGTPFTPPVWSLQECLDRFAQLYSWIKRVQASIYTKQGEGADWALRAAEELQRHRCRLDEFNEGARELVRHCPHVEEEVAWRLRYVNDAWQGVEAALTACGGDDELRYLRRWLCAMEKKLEPVSFHKVWTEMQLEARKTEHSVVQRDIQAHNSVVASVIRSCSPADGAALERQYHNLLLRCFEWQCHIEALLARQANKSPINVSCESDGEPVAKCPRFSHQQVSATDTGFIATYSSSDDQQYDVLMEPASPVLRRRDRMGRAKASANPRRQGIALFPDSVIEKSMEVDVMIAKARTTEEPFNGATNGSSIFSDIQRIMPNVANFEIRHEDTESESDRKINEEELGCKLDEGLSSASEGWSFEQKIEPLASLPRKKVSRSLFLEEPLEKAPSVQQLVEEADSLVRPKCAIESRDASGESDSDVGLATGKYRPRGPRPISLCSMVDLIPSPISRLAANSESALNKAETPRKRRIRSKKRFNSLRKQKSGSDGSPLCPPDLILTPQTIIKAESLSCIRRDSSDSSTQSESVTLLRDHESCMSGDVTLALGDDTGGEEVDGPKPSLNFRLGPDAGIVTATDSEKLGGEEPSSLNTEDCWDDYQDKYPSEAYSEEVADGKNLLDCDDYRQFLDSPSDTSRGPRRRRRHARLHQRRDSSDTESEPEEVQSLLEKSLSQLREVESLLIESRFPFSYEELLCQCRHNITCLKVYLDALSTEKYIIRGSKIRDALEQWKLLEERVQRQADSMTTLESEIEALRCELSLLASPCDTGRLRLQSAEELDLLIDDAKNSLNAIRERKVQILQLRSNIHRFSNVYSSHSASLKEEVNHLFELWKSSYDSVSCHLKALQELSQTLSDFEAHYAELNSVLRNDQESLRLLDTVLTNSDLAESVQDVAKVLSEKGLTSMCGLVDDPSLLHTEGSLSDSGISDSGSELELTEGKKRLLSLKNLARHLEAFLEPGSLALRGMADRLKVAEEELRGLQQTCREIIVRTGANPKEAVAVAASKALRPAGKRRKSEVSITGSCGGGPREPSWFWRVLRSALPFQLALVALLCVACLLEPQCCDSVNNLGLAQAANLRYVRGPPPV